MSQPAIETESREPGEAFSVVGSRQPRHDSRLKVSGAAVFGTDFSLPNMLRGKILRSQYAHAKIQRLDVSAAAAMPGVRAVVTSDDFPSKPFGPFVKDQSVLARDKVYYHGQPLCAVAADSVEIAERALGLVEVDYDPLPIIDSVHEAMKDDSEPIHPEAKAIGSPPYESRNVNSYTRIHRGNVERAFKESDFVLEETYSTQRVHHSYIEPKAVVSEIDASSGRIKVWAATQSPNLLRASLAGILQVPVSSIRVFSLQAGGGFGSKAAGEFEAISIALARKSGRPVKVVLTRSEELIAGTPRPSVHFWLKTGVKDGRIIARKARAIVDGGGFASEAPCYASIACPQLLGVYDVPNLDLEGISVYTNKQPAGTFRAPGSAETNFAVESHTDMLAKRAGMDPLEFRLVNCWADGSLGPTGQVLGRVGLKEVLNRVSRSIGWKQRRSFGGSESGSMTRYGVGIACAYIPPAASMGSSAFVKLNEDGKVILITGASDTGAGSLTALMMIAAEEMGVGLGDVELQGGDSDFTPYDAGAIGSRTTHTAGSAVLRAAKVAKEQLLDVAASVLKADKHRITLKDGVATDLETGRSAKFSELASSALSSKGGPIVGSGAYAMEYPAYDKDSVEGHVLMPSVMDPAFVAHAVVVSVDESTGKTAVERYVAAHDVGRAINPLGVEGQIHGGAVQGIGYALYEQIHHDEGGLTVNTDFGGYKLPTIADVPTIEAIIVEGYAGEGPYGAKAVGEGNIVPPAGAIANAIFDAVGVRVRDLPLSPEKVLQGMELADTVR
ncbi:MAG: xanthine dehydrogenase family protein molybdopterin-binding subunit [Nitrososphaerota archaeon]|nr:xanthine dehydrogenase family protein molybdopterin-binding subunit [Nitrososphaerota archaeon]